MDRNAYCALEKELYLIENVCPSFTRKSKVGDMCFDSNNTFELDWCNFPKAKGQYTLDVQTLLFSIEDIFPSVLSPPLTANYSTSTYVLGVPKKVVF